MELIRKLLINIQNGQPYQEVNGYPSDEIKYHAALLKEARLVEGTVLYGGSDEIPADVRIIKLTWEGHDFIEAITDDTKWDKVKQFLADAGKQITIETIKFGINRLFGPSA